MYIEIHAAKEFFPTSKVQSNVHRMGMNDTNSMFVPVKYVPHKSIRKKCFQPRDTVLPLCYGCKKAVHRMQQIQISIELPSLRGVLQHFPM